MVGDVGVLWREWEMSKYSAQNVQVNPSLMVLVWDSQTLVPTSTSTETICIKNII